MGWNHQPDIIVYTDITLPKSISLQLSAKK